MGLLAITLRKSKVLVARRLLLIFLRSNRNLLSKNVHDERKEEEERKEKENAKEHALQQEGLKVQTDRNICYR